MRGRSEGATTLWCVVSTSGCKKGIGTYVNPLLVKALQTAAVFIGAKVIEATIAELTEMKEKMGHKDPQAIPKVIKLVQGGKQ